MKKYFNPEMKISAFKVGNIITASGVDGVELTKTALKDAGITSIETKSLDMLNLLETE